MFVKRIALTVILTPFLVLLGLALFRKPLTSRSVNPNKETDMLYSVSVAKKGMALAAQFNRSYQIVYESTPTLFSKCDIVVTTGLEKHSPPDIILGYISSIKPASNSRYLEINISLENPCTRS